MITKPRSRSAQATLASLHLRMAVMLFIAVVGGTLFHWTWPQEPTFAASSTPVPSASERQQLLKKVPVNVNVLIKADNEGALVCIGTDLVSIKEKTSVVVGRGQCAHRVIPVPATPHQPSPASPRPVTPLPPSSAPAAPTPRAPALLPPQPMRTPVTVIPAEPSYPREARAITPAPPSVPTPSVSAPPSLAANQPAASAARRPEPLIPPERKSPLGALPVVVVVVAVISTGSGVFFRR